ncbi:MAG: hypothetical protein OXU61_04805 [Gammaproteobacteria bacterium]|nr:hypothetical protein [Gammaproteobacteria bacterium]
MNGIFDQVRGRRAYGNRKSVSIGVSSTGAALAGRNRLGTRGRKELP